MPRALFLISVGLGILLSSFAAPAQSRQIRAAKSATSSVIQPPVTEIDAEALKALLKRESQHPLLINFWATWCDPCRDEFPDLVKIDEQYGAGKLDFAAISLDDLKDIKTEVPRFLKQMNAKMPAYLLNVSDPELAINAIDPQWGGSLPATFLYNARGEIVYKHFGRVNVTELRTAIERLVGSIQ